MNQTDTLPWYKQFWPWFLITLPSVVIVACLFTAYLAVHNPLSMVKQDYYQEGLTINKNLDEIKRAKSFGLHAHVIFLQSSHSIQLVLTSKQKGAEVFQLPAELELQFNHPVDDAKDLSFILSRQTDNSFTSKNIATEQWNLIANEKHWYIQLQASKDGAVDWVLQAETDHPAQTDINLDASGG